MINRATVDTLILMLCMTTVVLPTIISKPLLAIFYLILFTRVIISKDLLLFLNLKLLIIIFFIPSMTICLINYPDNFIRFIPLFILILGFPFSTIKIKINWINKTSFIILFYFFFTGILLSFGNDSAYNFREAFYQNLDNVVRNYGVIEDFDEVLFKKSNFRLTGLYYNPNLSSLVATLFFFVFYISNRNLGINKKNKFRQLFLVIGLFMIFYFLLLTQSRTFIIALIAFLLIESGILRLTKLKINKKLFLVILASILFFYFQIERIFYGLFNSFGSISKKSKQFTEYMDQSNISQFIIGGRFDFFMDSGILFWFAALDC